MVQVEKVCNQDFKEINQLLKSFDLPEVDTGYQTGHYFKTTEKTGHIRGAIGLEIYGKSGLLRSLVVEESSRSKGIAGNLVNQIINYARSLGLDNLFLLTTTADKYFLKHQFVRIERNDVPAEIRESPEFSSICPVSAVVMQRKINLSPLKL